MITLRAKIRVSPLSISCSFSPSIFLCEYLSSVSPFLSSTLSFYCSVSSQFISIPISSSTPLSLSLSLSLSSFLTSVSLFPSLFLHLSSFSFISMSISNHISHSFSIFSYLCFSLLLSSHLTRFSHSVHSYLPLSFYSSSLSMFLAFSVSILLSRYFRLSLPPRLLFLSFSKFSTLSFLNYIL
ncbi:unnamed protein product [Acanthosepion pharaonis]|uniref:Uncharacterized protein n=1 Tax=Acanthosepion pharaonis TaxID=158019 RepID=A0A812EMR7_ACAPH|nr:unnamed protein product [Sepia pharaonis]